jgi:hypothetical protein
MDIIDQSGVLGTTDGTATEKVEQLIDKGEQANMLYLTTKYLNIDSPNGSPFNNGWLYNTIPKIDFSKITYLRYSFSGSPIEYIDYYINSENCINHADAFSFTKKLKWIVGIDLSSSTNLFDFLAGSAIETIQRPLNIAKVTLATYAFGCANLKDIRFVPECIKVSVSFTSAVLSDESIQSIIDGLATVETAQTLTLHATVKAKLTETQLDTITNKNWNLA